jgi:flagellar M-ring protein FliF
VRGDKITVKDFKFIGLKNFNSSNQEVDENGNVLESSGDSFDSISMTKSILKDFSEYFQYLIAVVLLFIFYKKFIVNHEVVILGERTNADGSPINEDDPDSNDFENEFDSDSANGRLKSKIKSQMLNNIEGLDEESAAKYSVFIEELDKQINENPADIAKMIELLLTEGNESFK